MIKHFFLAAALTAAAAPAVMAQAAPIQGPIPVTVDTTAATPVEQLQLANRLIANIAKTTNDYDRMQAIGNVVANLEVIPMKWPNAKRSIVEAYLMEAQVFRSHRMYANTEKVMRKAEKHVGETTKASAVYRELGWAQTMRGNILDAEKSFRLAEKPAYFNALNDVEKLKTLNEVAFFYTKHDPRPLEAARRLRQAADNPALDALTSAGYLVRSVEQWIEADRGEAARELAKLEQRFKAALGEPITNPAQLDARSMIEGQIKKFKTKLKK
jgi:hypothetical protein